MNSDTKKMKKEMNMEILLRDFTVSYGAGDPPKDRIADLQLQSGEITTLLGPNGSGKSTLLRGILGILPTKGSALLLEEVSISDSRQSGRSEKAFAKQTVPKKERRNIPALSHHVRAGYISYLPQKYEIPEMTVHTLVAHGRYSHHSAGSRLDAEDTRMIQHAMELTDILSLKDRYLRSLSGGELERSYLAMVIAQNTPWIFLDEPTAHTDSAHRIRFGEILSRLRGEGKGILLTSHNIPESFTLSDRIVLMQDGSVASSGTPEAIASDPDLMRSVLGTAVMPVPEDLRSQAIDRWILIR